MTAAPDPLLVPYIQEQLRGLAVPVASLTLDPKNARLHGDRNLASIRASLLEHGQVKPIVVRREGLVVIAGNGTLEAAKLLGWSYLAAVLVDHDNAQAAAFALADNRTAELAEWDWAQLSETLRELGAEAVEDLWDAKEFDALQAGAWQQPALATPPASPAPVVEDAEVDDLDPSDGIKPPFPWFGGKRKVAGTVWAALGDVDSYVEPFAGSLAVLLRRPADHQGRLATVNDLDRFVANFWRASHAVPDEVAEHADNPVCETDLEARHLWLVNEGRARLERMREDPDMFDAKVAGWWVWGLCCWIGSGWCSGTGPHGRGAPDLLNEGQGVNRKLPHLGNEGQGVNRQFPHLGNEGRGVNRQFPHLGNEGRGGKCDERRASLVAYMRSLRDALRDVRVCCGDWSRVVTDGATAYGTTVGVFLDPPYLDEVRTRGLYAEDAGGNTLAHEVRAWALSKGDDPRYRIVLAGYEPEHEEHMPASWRRVRWSATRAYGTASGADRGNRHLERLWVSPHCLKPGSEL